MKPLFGHLNAIGRDAARAASLATAQVERADRCSPTSRSRIEQGLNSVQTALGKPASEGRALLSAFKAAVQSIRDGRGGTRPRQGRSEDEEALFI